MKKVLSVTALVLGFATQSYAQELTPQAFFNRCYTQLTGKPVPLNHALMAKVVAGSIAPLEACKSILRKGVLNSSNQVNTTDSEARAVLNNFYTFHRTWFPSSGLETVSGYNTTTHNGTLDIYDATEPALAITYSVFGANQKYSSVLTRTTGVTAVRSLDTNVNTRMKWNSTFAGRAVSDNVLFQSSPFTIREPSTTNTVVSNDINQHKSLMVTDIPTIQIGELVGIRPTTQSYVIPNMSLQTGNRATDKGINVANLNYTYDIFKTFGGGVLGSPIYVLQYLGHGMNMKFNGQNKVARRWSQQNMESFLCASLPALRESDVASFVSSSSSAAFRNANSCVMCHATLDPMAYTARNITVGAMDFLRPRENGVAVKQADGTVINPPAAFSRNSMTVTSYKPTTDSVAGWPTEPVANFHLQKPTGRLYFRSATGTLVDRSVASISELGAEMVKTDDFYQCAAKRYFQFMTGIEVPLYDRTDPRNSVLNKALSPEAIKDREFVEDLAKNLRSSGSVVEMIEDIMNSNYYGKENFR